MSSLKQMKYTDSAGKETIVDLAVNAANIENNTFTQAAARANITSGDTLPTIWGKLSKWFADLKTVAWTGKYTDLTDKPAFGTAATHSVANNCSTTAANFVLDARQGQALQSNITQVDSRLTNSINQVDSRLTTSINQVDSRLTNSINQVNSNVTGLSGVVSPYLTGCVMTCDGANFYAQWGGLKKKLGDSIIELLYSNGTCSRDSSMTYVYTLLKDYIKIIVFCSASANPTVAINCSYNGANQGYVFRFQTLKNDIDQIMYNDFYLISDTKAGQTVVVNAIARSVYGRSACMIVGLHD